MSGRFVRASKYRHVFGEPAKPEKCHSLNMTGGDGDGNLIAANGPFIAFAASAGGGGPLYVLPRNKPGKLAPNQPTLNVHKAKLWDWQFSPFFDHMLATASDDLTVKVTIIPEGGLSDTHSEANASFSGHEKKPTLLQWNPVANNVLASASADYTVRVWDVEKQANAYTFADHHETPSALEWNYNGSVLGTACKDKIIRVFDPRAGPNAVSSAPGLEGAKPSKLFFASALNFVGIVGFSKNSTRMYSIHDQRNLSKPVYQNDIDNSAGVILPFYDPDNSILYMAGKGDGNIKYFEVTNEEPYVHFLSEFRSTESQKGCCFLPKRSCEVSLCEVAVAYRLCKSIIQPVSFQVPRKSEVFQGDIYPDTFAGVPSLSADQWFGGANAEPKLVSMKPGASPVPDAAPSAAAVAFKPQKSAADLAKELDVAKARIAELEAEVARLKGGK